MPISRFLEFLIESGNYEGYMERLANAFNPAAAAGVMCRYTLSVGWEGTLYDCDFKPDVGLALANGTPRHIRDFDLAKTEREDALSPRITATAAPLDPAHPAAVP